MYVHVGNNISVNGENIVGIFDLENTTISKLGRNFLKIAEKSGKIVDAAEDIPVSYVVTVDDLDNTTVYFSSISTKTLLKRANENKFMDEIQFTK